MKLRTQRIIVLILIALMFVLGIIVSVKMVKLAIFLTF
jgi:hypothetical protein